MNLGAQDEVKKPLMLAITSAASQSQTIRQSDDTKADT